MSALTVCAKSTWDPAMRREHAFTRLALEHGVAVTFVEAPGDARDIGRTGPRAFGRGLRGGSRTGETSGLRLVTRTTVAPGHRARLAEWMDVSLLRRVLAARAHDAGATICNLPWQWDALSDRRFRVFDCADDWTRLLRPGRAGRLERLFAQIADEADAVIVASPDLRPLFGGRDVRVVPNGADPTSITDVARPRPGSHSLAYVGTFSERFDTDAADRLLRSRPQSHLELYGPCHYAGAGDRPGDDLRGLLAAFPDRVRWHGAISRRDVPAAIDGADVVIVPHRPGRSLGQSSMKLFDSAARGRAVVVSAGVSCVPGGTPPGTYVVEHGDDWADAVAAAEDEPADAAPSRIAWAKANTWQSRWPLWARSVLESERKAVPV